jgi:peroxiredoxin
MEPKNTESFVDRQMASLEALPGWSPDKAAGLKRYRATETARRQRRLWAAGGAAAACAVVLAFPATRVLAERCVAACVAETVAVGHRLGIGAAPGFTLTDASGKTVRLADFRGKVVLLNFWATWCPPCMREIPWFTEFQAKYEAEGLVVLGVSMDEGGWDAVRPLLGKMPVNYRMMLGNDAVAKEFGGVNSLPSTFLIDRAGRVAVTHEGIVDRTALERELHSLLASR